MMVGNSRCLGVKAIELGNGVGREVKEREMLRMTWVSHLHSWEDAGICHTLVKEK